MNLEYVRNLTFAPIVQHYDIRDSALYALSLGMGQDPLDEDELPYIYERRGPLAVPSQCVTLCWPPFWHREPETGIAWRRILHGEQSFSLVRPLPAEARSAASIGFWPSKTRAPTGAPSSTRRTTFSTTRPARFWRTSGPRSFYATMAAAAGSGRPRN